jgi:hypothetical protein
MSVWPPLIMIIWVTLALGINLAVANGKDLLLSFGVTGALCALLWWGGFFDPLLR